MKLSSKYFSYLAVTSLLEVIAIFFTRETYAAYSVIIFALLTFGLFGFRSAFCFYKVITHIKLIAPALYNKYVVRLFGLKMFDRYLIRDQKIAGYLDDEARDFLQEYNLLKGYLFVSFFLFTAFSFVIVLK